MDQRDKRVRVVALVLGALLIATAVVIPTAEAVVARLSYASGTAAVYADGFTYADLKSSGPVRLNQNAIGGAAVTGLYTGAGDPSGGGGVVANEGSVLLQDAGAAGALWVKSGAAATAWNQVQTTASLPAPVAVGDMIAAGAGPAWGIVTDVAAGSYMRSGGVGVLPLWSTLLLPNAATQGDILTATGANTIGILADGATAGMLLRAGGAGDPSWSTFHSIPADCAAGDLWYASAAHTMAARAVGNTADVLTVSGGMPTWAPPATHLYGEMYQYANEGNTTIIDTAGIYHLTLFYSSGSLNGWTFDAGSSGAITAYADAGGGKVTVTSALHGMSNGEVTTIAGSVNYNGVYVVSNVAANTFEVTAAWAGNDAVGSFYHGSNLKAGASSAGTYEIAWEASVSSLTGTVTTDIHPFVNATGTTNVSARFYMPDANFYVMSGHGVVTIAASDYATLGISNNTDTNDYKFSHANVTITKL